MEWAEGKVDQRAVIIVAVLTFVEQLYFISWQYKFILMT